MTMPLDALEAEVLNLPPLQRSHLLDRLITSLETDPEIQEAWAYFYQVPTLAMHRQRYVGMYIVTGCCRQVSEKPTFNAGLGAFILADESGFTPRPALTGATTG